jgi:hypothetical protein
MFFFLWGPWSTSTMKMEAAWSSEILVSNHHTTQNPENHKFYLHCHENLKSWTITVFIHRACVKNNHYTTSTKTDCNSQCVVISGHQMQLLPH